MIITFLNIVFIVTCLFLVLVILLQPGKGGSMASTFGGATSQQVFGGRGASSLLERLTIFATVLFMVLALLLSYLGARSGDVNALREKEAQQARINAQESAKKMIEDQASAKKKAEAAAPMPITKTPSPVDPQPQPKPKDNPQDVPSAPKVEPKTEAPKVETPALVKPAVKPEEKPQDVVPAPMPPAIDKDKVAAPAVKPPPVPSVDVMVPPSLKEKTRAGKNQKSEKTKPVPSKDYKKNTDAGKKKAVDAMTKEEKESSPPAKETKEPIDSSSSKEVKSEEKTEKPAEPSKSVPSDDNP